jgi:hypothetical protein
MLDSTIRAILQPIKIRQYGGAEPDIAEGVPRIGPPGAGRTLRPFCEKWNSCGTDAGKRKGSVRDLNPLRYG